MAGIAYELIDILKKQKECYEGLITLAEYKKNAIVNKNIEFLQEVVKTEEQFVGRLDSLDNKRDSLMKDIAIVIGMDYKRITVTAIINKLGEENDAAKELIVLRNETKELLEQLKKQSEVNKYLLKQSLEIVDFMINAVGSTKGYVHTGNYSNLNGKFNNDGEEIMDMQREQSIFDQKQ